MARTEAKQKVSKHGVLIVVKSQIFKKFPLSYIEDDFVLFKSSSWLIKSHSVKVCLGSVCLGYFLFYYRFHHDLRKLYLEMKIIIAQIEAKSIKKWCSEGC